VTIVDRKKEIINSTERQRTGRPRTSKSDRQASSPLIGRSS